MRAAGGRRARRAEPAGHVSSLSASDGRVTCRWSVGWRWQSVAADVKLIHGPGQAALKVHVGSLPSDVLRRYGMQVLGSGLP